MPATLPSARTIFLEAVENHAPDTWPEFLDTACGVDGTLRREVQRLLDAHAHSTPFMQHPAAAPAGQVSLPATPIGTTIGRYKLLEQIGEGGMGIVYVAEQIEPVRRQVALKIIKPGMDTRQVIACFEAERQTLALMEHPNIARILDAGTTEVSTKSQASSNKQIQSIKSKAQNEESSSVSVIDASNLEFVCDLELGHCDFTAGRPYFVMELVRGQPITDYCEQSQLTPRQKLELFITVCQAVQHAHQKGIIHRDLKPSNVLVALQDGQPVPKIIDFGVAKAVSPLPLGEGQGEGLPTLTSSASKGGNGPATVHTSFAQMIGTPLYMSPEQADPACRDIDTTSDVYSLGVLLYELLTGSTPFDQEQLKTASFDELRRIIREDEPETVSARLAKTKSSRHAPRAEAQSSRHTPCAVPSNGTRSVPPIYRRIPRRTELDHIVAKSLAKDRSRRYESASSLAADLQRFLNDEPVHACPPSVVYHLRKLFDRHRSRVAFAGLLAITFFALAFVGIANNIRNTNHRREITQQVRQFLTATRTAIEADDSVLAGQRLSEAKGRLGGQLSSLPILAAEVDVLATEVESRHADRQRFEKFKRLALFAQEKITYGRHREGELAAREALALYGVGDNPDWPARLKQSYLSHEQRQQLPEIAYETLVSLAHNVLHFGPHEKNGAGGKSHVQESLELLARAESFHEPTRALWRLRRSAHRALQDWKAAEADNQRFNSTRATTALDHFLPGQLAAWGGNRDEAIRSYEAALHIQPDHFNSLFFLGERLQQQGRDTEAIAYFTGCIALNPKHFAALATRAQCLERLGRLEDAEADMTRAVEVADSESRRRVANKLLQELRASHP